jgi:hypothetical protein
MPILYALPHYVFRMRRMPDMQLSEIQWRDYLSAARADQVTGHAFAAPSAVCR